MDNPIPPRVGFRVTFRTLIHRRLPVPYRMPSLGRSLRNMKNVHCEKFSEREAVQIAKQHLEKEGHQFVSVRQCVQRRALKWFGPVAWALFIEVEDKKEFGVTFMENNPVDIYSHEISSN